MPKALLSCPSCHHDQLKIVYTHGIHFDPSYSSFEVAEANCLLQEVFEKKSIERSLVRCEQCGLHFISPSFTNEELTRLYNFHLSKHYSKVKGYSRDPSHHFQNPQAEWDSESQHSRYIFEQVKSKLNNLPTSTVVDMGGKFGYHLRYFAQAGAKAYVQDFVQQSELYPGVSYIPDIDSLEQIDFVNCTHVLEHLTEIKPWLENISKRQNSGSLIYIEVPYELDARLRHKNFGTPQHVNFYSPLSLENALAIHCYRKLSLRIRKLTYGGQPMIALSGLFEKQSEQVLLRSPLPNLVEIGRGIPVRLLNKFYPQAINAW